MKGLLRQVRDELRALRSDLARPEPAPPLVDDDYVDLDGR